jgi:hypothetical protein
VETAAFPCDFGGLMRKSRAVAPPAKSIFSRAIRTVLDRPYSTVGVVLLSAIGISLVSRSHPSEWDTIYVAAARMLLGGKDIYKDLSGYTYPPFSALLMTPFTYLPSRVGRTIWCAVSAGALVYLVRTAWRLAGGRPLEPVGGKSTAGPRDHFAFLIGQVVALQFAMNAMTHLQADLLIAAILMAGVAAIAAGNFFRAATWIGLAAAFKATPLAFAPYLLWRGKWRPACWLFCVAIAANLLPNLVSQPPGGGLWLAHWCQQYLRPMVASNYVPGDWKNSLNNNQSLEGAVNRWLTATPEENETKPADDEQPRHVPARAIRAVFVACALVVILPVFWMMWKRWALPERGTEGSRPDPRMIECGLVLLLMLLFSPNSSRAHFCILYLPAFCVARLASEVGKAALLRMLLLGAAVSSTLSIHIRLPGTLAGEQALLWLGVVTFSTLFLLWASLTALKRLPQQAFSGQPAESSA